MTTATTTLSALLAACEAEPSVALFSGIADLYEEAGDERMAFAWGWMARKGKWPNRLDATDYRWSSRGTHGEDRHYRLPIAIAQSSAEVSVTVCLEPTFLECVQWLADRLAEVRAAL